MGGNQTPRHKQLHFKLRITNITIEIPTVLYQGKPPFNHIHKNLDKNSVAASELVLVMQNLLA